MVMLTISPRKADYMAIQFMSRSDYCTLAGLEVEQFNVLRRRDQVPSVPNLDLSEQVANERGYEAGGALLLIVANELVERYEISREYAARIAEHGRLMFNRWGDVAATSAQVAAGKEPLLDILLAVIDWPGAASGKAKKPKVAVGTLKEIAEQHSNIRDIIAISLTRCAALMRQRAAKARINLDEFWRS
jgi:hypothetical protein